MKKLIGSIIFLSLLVGINSVSFAGGSTLQITEVETGPSFILAGDKAQKIKKYKLEGETGAEIKTLEFTCLDTESMEKASVKNNQNIVLDGSFVRVGSDQVVVFEPKNMLTGDVDELTFYVDVKSDSKYDLTACGLSSVSFEKDGETYLDNSVAFDGDFTHLINIGSDDAYKLSKLQSSSERFTDAVLPLDSKEQYLGDLTINTAGEKKTIDAIYMYCSKNSNMKNIHMEHNGKSYNVTSSLSDGLELSRPENNTQALYVFGNMGLEFDHGVKEIGLSIYTDTYDYFSSYNAPECEIVGFDIGENPKYEISFKELYNQPVKSVYSVGDKFTVTTEKIWGMDKFFTEWVYDYRDLDCEMEDYTETSELTCEIKEAGSYEIKAVVVIDGLGTYETNTLTIEAKGDTDVDSKTPPAGYEDKVLTKFSINPFPDTNINDLVGLSAAELYRRAVIGGYPDGEFKASKAVNRAEAAKFLLLARYGSINLDKTNNGKFKDVLDGEWYVPYIVEASEKGIIKGYSDGNYRPANTVNTAEFLKMLSLVFDLELNMSHSYEDVENGVWYAQYAGVAERYELFPSRDKFLYPSQNMTRGEVAVAIYQYLKNR